MGLSDNDILSLVRAQLAIDLNCSADDFDRDGFVFSEAKENPGRRPFPRGERHFEMLTMGGAVIVSATPDILPYLREQLDGKNRDDAFYMPFVHSSRVYFLPDNPCPLPMPDGIDVKILELEHKDKVDIVSFCELTGFDDADYQYYVNHPRPIELAALAMADGNLAGMAGVNSDCEMMRQIGLTVQPEYRNRNIAAVLTNRLAFEIMAHGKVPYYGTPPSNVASQRVAHRAGFKPAWICAYRGRFDDTLTSPTG